MHQSMLISHTVVFGATNILQITMLRPPDSPVQLIGVRLDHLTIIILEQVAHCTV